jgi:SOS response regulatory protein OraA/RecX
MIASPRRLEIQVPRSRERRVSILTDGSRICDTSRDVLTAAGIEDGATWDLDKLSAAIRSVEPGVARERAVLLLGHRERTRHELQERLEREGLSAEPVADVLDRLSEVGALSDERYAEWFTRSKVGAGWGRPRIEHALRQKGVADDLAQSFLDEFAPLDGEVDRARAVIGSRPLEGPKERDRALAKLARKGFAPPDALSALRLEADGPA